MEDKRRKRLYVLLAVFLVIVLLTGLCAAVFASESGPASDSVTIIYTNDVHTYINNTEEDEDGNVTPLLSYSNVAAMKEELEAEGENVLLVDDGDHAQGTAYGALDEGSSVMHLMNAAGYDIATLGNHEFDYGMERLFEIVDEADFPYVACNFYNTADGSLVLPAYEILNAGGVKVAFIGIMTPDTYTAAPSSYFEDEDGNQIYGIYGVEDQQDLYDSVQAAIDEIGDSADYVIALGHLGVDAALAGKTSRDVIENTTGLDAFIDGHSHTVMESETVTDAAGNDVILTQTGCYLNAIGVMHLENGEVTTELVTDYPERDETVQALTDAWIEEVDDCLGEQIAVSGDDLTIMDAADPDTRIIRREETNLGDFEADAMYYYFNEVEQLDCDVAIANGGGIRADIPAGEVDYTALKTVQPFGNVDCMVRITGAVLKEVLEYSAWSVGVTGEDGLPAEFGGFLQVAGVKFTIDPNMESTVQMDTDGAWAGAPTGEYKVSDIQVYNRDTEQYEDLDPEKTYTVAGCNYLLREGGNGYNMFEDSELVLDYVGEDYMITADYCQRFAAGEDGYPYICSENSPLASYENYLLDYENPYGSGRITIG